ncbi:MAG: beta-ribofuranosylaminobenzene 5'-phosphate synthase family protein [Pseudomonadota bacterium]
MPSLASQSPTRTTVHVVAPARLHLGFLDLDGTLGRRYGSIGLAIDQPATELSLEHSSATDNATQPEPQVEVRGSEHARITKLLRSSLERYGFTGNFELKVTQTIPPHAGLGSGTQLALAIGTAVAEMSDKDAPAHAIGQANARGARSAIGIAAFEKGGFLVDGGRGIMDRPAPMISRLEFPDAWRAILVFDRSNEGVHGEKEASAFANLPTMPQNTAAHLCHLTLMKLLPAIVEQDLTTFGAALQEIQRTVGEHFAPHQGGTIWASPRVGDFMQQLADAGAVGIGQSSWGPTGFAFTSDPAIAHNIVRHLQSAAHQHGLDLQIVRGRNSGARVTKNGPRLEPTKIN